MFFFLLLRLAVSLHEKIKTLICNSKPPIRLFSLCVGVRSALILTNDFIHSFRARETTTGLCSFLFHSKSILHHIVEFSSSVCCCCFILPVERKKNSIHTFLLFSFYTHSHTLNKKSVFFLFVFFLFHIIFYEFNPNVELKELFHILGRLFALLYAYIYVCVCVFVCAIYSCERDGERERTNEPSLHRL